RSLKVFLVTVMGDPPAQKLFFARFCSLFASSAPSSGFGRPSFSQLVSKGRCMLMVSKGKGQPGMNLSGVCALRAVEEAVARQTPAVMLRIQRIAFSFARSR